jgi:hypothetical protein
LLAGLRNPDSDVAGSAPLHHHVPRFSRDARAMPAGKEGLLFLKDGRPVQPDPEKLDSRVEHPGQLRGHWPSSSESGSAVLEQDNETPKP